MDIYGGIPALVVWNDTLLVATSNSDVLYNALIDKSRPEYPVLTIFTSKSVHKHDSCGLTSNTSAVPDSDT